MQAGPTGSGDSHAASKATVKRRLSMIWKGTCLQLLTTLLLVQAAGAQHLLLMC